MEDFYPLSPAQEGMLFHSVLDSGPDMYLSQLAWRLGGPLQADALQAAWQWVADRHAVLRTVFVWEGVKQPVQVVHRKVQTLWRYEDWQGDEQSKLSAFLSADRAARFDLRRGPLMRLALFRLSAESHILVWTRHHILMDGWSAAVVFEEVLAAYRELRAQRTPLLPEAPRYRDYIRWLHRQDLDRALRYWRAALVDARPTPFPGAPSRDSSGIGRQDLILKPGLERDLRSFARTHGLTLNTLFQYPGLFRTAYDVYRVRTFCADAPLEIEDGTSDELILEQLELEVQ